MKKLLSFFLSILVLNISSVSAFSDVRTGSQLETTIDILSEVGILSGYPDGTFKPEQSINRAEALKIIFATIEETKQQKPNNNPFPDVPQSEWFAPYIQSAKDKGIISGYPDGNYRPNQFVNRAEFVKIAMSALPFFETIPQDKGKAIGTYDDVYDPLWYTSYLSAALELQLLPQTATFRPTEPMQRQEAAEIMLNIYQYLQDHPQSTAQNNRTPYVPEEAFLVVDPTLENTYNPKEFGPERLIIKRGPNKTEIFNKYSGYNVTIPELVSAKALEISDWQLTIDYFDRECMMDIYTNARNGMNAEEYQDESYASAYTPPLSKELSSFVNPQGITIYQANATWSDIDPTQDYFIFNNDKVYHFSAFGYGENAFGNCRQLIPEVINTFEIR